MPVVRAPKSTENASTSAKLAQKTVSKEIDEVRSKVETRLKEFEITVESGKKVMTLLHERFEEGLSRSHENATLKMLPSYVRALPNGEGKIGHLLLQHRKAGFQREIRLPQGWEKILTILQVGSYLALDLGGTNFRVLLVTLEGGRKSTMKSKIYDVPEGIMVGTGEELFDHIAACLASFIKEEVPHPTESFPLGFTFSFPVDQKGLMKGYLVTWTKGFKCSGVVGRNVVKMLQKAVKKRGDYNIYVVGILNDTTGCMMSCAFLEPTCCIGVIVGTGANACYMENISKIPKLDDLTDDGQPEEMCINTEWGAFGDDGCLDWLRTSFDRVVDAASINPGKHLFEKMISGMYMGEVTRLALVDLIKAGLLLKSKIPEVLNTPGSFLTKYVSKVELDLLTGDTTFPHTMDVLLKLGVTSATLEDCELVLMTCIAVSSRAAHLCAAGVATLVNRMQRPFVTVSFDGSVYRYHPFFKDRVTERLALLVDPGREFKLMLSVDGSGRGAALVAAVAVRLKKEMELRGDLTSEDRSTIPAVSPNASRPDSPSVTLPEDETPVRLAALSPKSSTPSKDAQPQRSVGK